ncbi:MAG: TonB-dependent receptor [Cellvibrionaceae bacterium]
MIEQYYTQNKLNPVPKLGGVKTSIGLLAAAICLASATTNAVAQTEGFVLEEIVVTAQKRSQNLQDVPIAVSAFDGEQLQEAVIKDIYDLKNSAPGLQSIQEQSNSSSGFSIRGIGTSGQNFGLESSVGMYVDGVYRARQSSMISEMIDIEAVEILRGPQGTLFGKNTPAGAILFRTVAPSHETDSYVSVTGGNYGQLNASAAGNLSVIDDVLALRGTVFSSHRDGTIDVEGFGDEALNDRNRQGARLQALWTPYDDLTVRVIADYSEIDETCCGVLVAQDSYNVANGASGSDAILEALGGTVYHGNNVDNFNTSLNFLPESNSRDRGLSIDTRWDLDSNYSLNFITGYRNFNSNSLVDADFSNVDLLATQNDVESTSFSQEIRLDYSGDSLNFVVGAYYFQQDLDLDYELTGGDRLSDFVKPGLGANGVDYNDFQGLLALKTLGAQVPTNDVFIPGMAAAHTAKQEHKSWAIFGQFDYQLTDDVILTAGLRYTEEDKEMSTVFSENWTPADPTSQAAYEAGLTALLVDAGFVPGVPATSVPYDNLLAANPNFFDPFTQAGWGGYLFPGLTPREDINVKLSDEQITGTVKISWLANEDTMVYASYGTGYKSGGTNTDRIATGFDPVFDAETSQSFEVGVKTEFPDQAVRFNAALHYTTVDDFQANTFVGTGFVLQNAGELESYGGELELFWVAQQNTEVSLNYAYTHAEYKEFEQAGCQIATPTHTGIAETRQLGSSACDRSGDKLSNTPEHAVNLGVKQVFSLSDNIDAYVYGEYTFLSGLVNGNDNDPLKEQKDFGLLNLRAGMSFVDENIDLTLWGRNILDESYKGSTFDAPLQDGKLFTSPGEPRTYGVTLNKRF